ncbi:MAG: methionine--tRNA ligase [Alphaproteobacteria bacterium 43-37]|nr:MAG: methionine--tRNA ligase [Alphaproteobacteria bacterium 43-37]
MSQLNAYYITTPIYYVNDVPHIGHAYTTIICDMVARFMRLDGKYVFFATGTDEHGQKNAKTAEAQGRAPQQHVDLMSQNFRNLMEVSHISNDDFIRTTEPRHIAAAQALWTALEKNGQIYMDKYAGWYSMRDEAYYAETEVKDGIAVPTGSPVEWVEEPSYFFKLSEWQDKLLDFYKRNPNFVAPKTRFNEVIRFVESGLKDLSISRTTFNWGVPVPNNKDHVMYVWLDALTNYMTCVGYPDIDSADFKRFWPANVHVVGKDILRFHAVYWPAFLMAAGIEPPRQVYAHGWWTVDGQKMSKSLKNAVDPLALYETYGLDQVRYFMAREVPFGSDGDFSSKALILRSNSDLANDYGNLVHRVLSFIFKNCGGTLPVMREDDLSNDDKQMLRIAKEALSKVRTLMNEMSISKAVEEVWNVIAHANKYIDAQKPWGLKESNPDRMKQIMAILTDVIRRLAILTQPIIPDASAKILDMICLPEDDRTFAHFDKVLGPNIKIPEPVGVFKKWEEPNEVS